MDEFTRELELFEVIAASDAITNTRTILEDAEEADGGENAECWEGIRAHVLPLLEAERGRLDGEYCRLRDG